MGDLEKYFALRPEVAAELYLWASEVVDDFDDYGPVIQSGEDGQYGDSTALGRLRAVRDSVVKALESAVGPISGPSAVPPPCLQRIADPPREANPP